MENIVGQKENAAYQHFLPFPQCFQKTFSSSPFPPVHQKSSLCGNGLTSTCHKILQSSKLTNVCIQPFECNSKWWTSFHLCVFWLSLSKATDYFSHNFMHQRWDRKKIVVKESLSVRCRPLPPGHDLDRLPVELPGQGFRTLGFLIVCV